MRSSLPLLVLLLGAPLAAQQPAAPAEVTVEGITAYTLENGMQVLLFPDNSRPTTTVNVTYFVGSRHEAYGETGMAHLLEHLVFKGTPRHPNIPQELSERGAAPNGTTWFDRTNYFETFPASTQNLRWALDLEADRMVNSFIAAKDLESEMTVVRNEFESGENDPGSVLLDRVLSTAFLWHNYGKSTIGARSDIENVPIERLQGFYRKYYQPDNAMLVIAGKFDPDTARAMVAATFGALPRPERAGGTTLWPTYTLDPVQDGERTVTLRRVGDVQSIVMAWHVPHGSHPDFAAVDVLADVLGATATGRLYRAVVEPKLASRVSAFSFQLREPGVFLVQATVPRDADVAAARAAILGAIDSLLDVAPATPAEVERAKAALLKGIELQYTNPGSVGLALSEWASMGDWRLFFLHRDRTRAVTPDDVMRVARAYLKPSNRTVGIFVPDSAPDRAVLPEAPDVLAMVKDYRGTQTMATGEDFDPTPANLDARTETFTLPNGIEVAFLPKRNRGALATATMTFRFGSEATLSGRGAVPGLTGQMLMRGTTRLSRQELRDEINRLQATLNAGGGAASAGAGVTAKRSSFNESLRLALEILREPRFDPAELELLKQEGRTALEGQRSEPQMQAVMAIQRHLSPFPPGHPNYVGTLDEQLAMLDAATLEQVRAFYAGFYGASRGQIAVVGDFDPDSVRAILTEGLRGWESAAPYERIATPTGASAPLDVTLETPDKANAMFLAARTMPLTDTSPDYPAMLLADYMLGGGFLNSRLATRIRQQDGLSYGVGSTFNASATDTTAQWISFAIYAPENRDKLEAAFREELERAARDGFTAEEISKAKEGWIESRKLARSNDGPIAGRLVSNLYLGRTFAHDSELEAAVLALTGEELRAAVARYLDPDALAYVKAGDFQKPMAEPTVP
ncbi:MAG TPA: pitrilysin family protein [Gemmatimonadales bacterium]|nr:insulinase family protein [Gemmatimonadales bacterium]MCB9517808.1 insulinase family protein [Gemmatimonadales bacterium]HPF60581.1 pitrilysin family protein [Gemmatimonadales bacterium]HRX18863.1 pitrilysin family protein [Gemmatimonadales bacterium]